MSNWILSPQDICVNFGHCWRNEKLWLFFHLEFFTLRLFNVLCLHHNSQSWIIIFVHWTQLLEYWSYDTNYMLWSFLGASVLVGIHKSQCRSYLPFSNVLIIRHVLKQTIRLQHSSPSQKTCLLKSRSFDQV